MAPESPAPPCNLRRTAPLAPLTTLELGGAARWLTTADTENGLVDALRWAEQRDLPVTLLGGGSNVVVADHGIDGLVIRIAMAGVEIRRDADGAVVTAAAGVPWDEVVESTVEEGLSGLECLSGIPGTTGATPIQNVGAYGVEVGEVLETVRLLDRGSGTVREALPTELGLGYRTSRLRREPGRFVVLSASFRLRFSGGVRIRYPELARTLEAGSAKPGPVEIRQAVLELRRSKSMVIDAGDPNRRSAGSFFKNPMLSRAEVNDLTHRVRHYGISDPPLFPMADDEFKVPAGWLIERAGFNKGLRRGNVGLSERHSLALVNLGGGTAAELVALAREIQDGVRQCFGIVLEPEPVFLGFDTTNPLDDTTKF